MKKIFRYTCLAICSALIPHALTCAGDKGVMSYKLGEKIEIKIIVMDQLELIPDIKISAYELSRR